jgi:hypothetical protein
VLNGLATGKVVCDKDFCKLEFVHVRNSRLREGLQTLLR